MNKRNALSILMLSPFYFKMSVAQRKALLDEFCKNYGVFCEESR